MLNKFKETIEEIKRGCGINYFVLETKTELITADCGAGKGSFLCRECQSKLNQHYKTSLIWANNELDYFKEKMVIIIIEKEYHWTHDTEKIEELKEIKRICEENLK